MIFPTFLAHLKTWILELVSCLDSIDLTFLGFDFSFWGFLVAFFCIGSIINIIFGDSDDENID